MKKYIVVLTAVCTLLFCACSKMLDIPQKGVVAYETYYTSDEAAEAALVNVYAKMVQNVYGSIGNWNPYFFMMNYSADDVFAAAFYHKQVTILYATDKAHLVTAEFLIEEVNERTGILRREIATVVGLYSAILANADNVAAKCKIQRVHLIADGSGFKRTTTFINLVEVIAEDCCIGNLRTWVVSLRYGDKATSSPHFCQHIHVRSLGELQWSLSAEFFYGFICHSIAQNYYVFHNRFSFKCLRLT